MLNKHSEARLLRGSTEAEMDDPQAQYINIIPVEAEPDRESPIFTNPDVPSAVRKYYEHSYVFFDSLSNLISNG